LYDGIGNVRGRMRDYRHMTESEARRWVRAQGDDDEPDRGELEDAFVAIFGREPDADDEETCTLWDHLCAAVYVGDESAWRAWVDRGDES
jgi:hypothetical protein